MSEDTADTGPLTREQAVEMLVERPEPAAEPTAPEAPVEAAEEQPEPEGESNAPEDAGEAEDQPGDSEEAEQPEAEAEAEPLKPPQYWTKEEAEAFGKLDRDTQEILLRQEGKRESHVAKAKAESAQAIQAAEEKVKGVQQLADVLAERVPKWLENFEGRWGTGEPDWLAMAHEHGSEATNLAKFQYDAELKQLAEAEQVRAVAETTAREASLKAEFEKLKEVAPDLADPVTGPKARGEVGQFLIEAGVPKENLPDISAVEMSLAYDAMQWRRAQAAVKARPTLAPKPAPKPAAVRPPSGQAQTSTQRTATQVANRFAQTRSVDDAVALLMARKA